MKKKVVISAIALRSGGTLSVLHDCLRELSHSRYGQWEIVAFVADPETCSRINPGVVYHGVDNGSNYLRRLFFEYWVFRRFSKRFQPDIWLSLHDLTPLVTANVQVVYCHNPAPFYSASLRDFRMDPVLGIFTLLYKYAYRLNIHKNDYVVVQQQWIRDRFAHDFSVDPGKIIVAHPSVFPTKGRITRKADHIVFIYPTLPRVFKNIEVIGAAARILEGKNVPRFEIKITIDGEENAYARSIVAEFRDVKSISFIGRQPRESIFDLYGDSDYLIFPSRLETWGLPISEFKSTGKGIIAADLPYAHETVGNYEKACFFDPASPQQLAGIIAAIMEGNQIFSPHSAPRPSPPAAMDWTELFNILSASSIRV